MGQLEEKFHLIVSDRSSGSTRILLNFLNLLISQKPDSGQIVLYCERFLSLLPHFAIIQNVMSHLLSKQNLSQNHLEELVRKINSSAILILQRVREVLSSTQDIRILTLSNSETLRVC